jgi:flavorubredoxin
VEQQLKNLKEAKVAVLYASAYGNTATLAQAISRGITKAGVGVEMVNLEQASLEEAEKAMADAQGFCIGAQRFNLFS